MFEIIDLRISGVTVRTLGGLDNNRIGCCLRVIKGGLTTSLVLFIVSEEVSSSLLSKTNCLIKLSRT